MLPPLLRLLRPGDWTKNVFVLPAVVFSLPRFVQEGTDAVVRGLLEGAAAFACFCLVASAFYAVNDVLDVEKDRRHPVKRHRPIASGAVSPNLAVLTALVLAAGGFGLALATDRGLAVVLLLYALLQVVYNWFVKRIMLLDVIGLATGFALRATAGAVAIDAGISIWMLLCVFFLCLFLGFVKRLCDLSSAAAEGRTDWKSPAGYDDRIELNWLLGISAVLAVMTYLMYALSDHARAIFGARAIGFALLSPLVLLVIHRFYRRASRGTSDSPLGALLEDRVVLASILLYGAGTVTVLLVPPVERALDRTFLLAGPDPTQAAVDEVPLIDGEDRTGAPHEGGTIGP